MWSTLMSTVSSAESRTTTVQNRPNAFTCSMFARYGVWSAVSPAFHSQYVAAPARA